jgi:SH3-like domain-containing protein
VYLTDQAKALVAPARRGADLPVRSGERSFATPVPFTVTRRGNVREGPGTGFKVLFTVTAGTALTGYAYTDQWVKVTDGSGRSGWVAKELLPKRR